MTDTLTSISVVRDEDDIAFDAQWNDWSAKTLLDCLPQDQDALRAVCRLWFTRGVVQGVKWADSTNERVLTRTASFPAEHPLLRSLSEVEQERLNQIDDSQELARVTFEIESQES